MKRMNRSVYLWVLVLWYLWGCTTNRERFESSQVDYEAEEASIKATLTNMWDAIEKKDIDRYASYVHPDFTQFGETDSVLRRGKEAEVKAIKQWMETSENVHTEMVDPRITIRGKTAWIVYYWEDAGFSRGEHFESRGKSTRIFVKENGKWLCIHGHYTLLPNRLRQHE